MVSLLEETKLYLRVDGTEDDGMITNLLTSAAMYIENAIGEVNSESDLYKLAMMLLVCHWYERREVVGKADALKFSLESILQQLKYKKPSLKGLYIK